jgi:hypothetical protein
MVRFLNESQFQLKIKYTKFIALYMERSVFGGENKDLGESGSHVGMKSSLKKWLRTG